jgi:YD repeat-containing protein
MLKVAYDPHYAGAMTKIRYTYQGHECRIQDQPAPGFEPYVGAHFDYYLSPSTAIAAEKSDHSDQFGPIRVSSFGIGCFNGTRTETNGFGAWRLFNYGSSAGAQGNYHCMGYQLAKLTDFTLAYPYPNDLPFERQNYMSGQPRQIWDARGIETDAMVTPGDASGQPGEIHHVTADGSYQVFNRVNAGTSDGQDFAKIPNRYNHWLFSHRDERGLTTIYRRDSRRQVVDIIYPDTNSEHFTYNDWNQVVTHTLASHTSEHPAIVHYDYDGFHRLVQVWNEVDGQANAVIYTYDALERVATISYPWSRATGASFGVALTYNGRHQIIGEEYPATSSGPNPAKSYEYDDYGNCTAITDEMGHRSTYAYDDYRRCISYVEPLNAPDGNGGPPVPSRRWDWLYDRYIPEIGLRDSYSHTKNEWRVQVGPVFNYLGERPMTARFHDLQNRITLEASGYIQRAAPAPIGDWYWNPDVEVHYFSYDANGNKSRYTDPRGRVTTYDYDLRTGFGRPMRRSTQSRARLKRSTTPPATKRWSDFLIPPLSSGSTIRPLGRPSVSSTSGAIPPILIINGGR